MCVWSSDAAAPEVEIHVVGEACNVAAAKLDVAEALVATCSAELKPLIVAKEPPPPAPTAVPYQAAAFSDWSQAATPWAAWANNAAPLQCSPAMMAPAMMAQPSALLAQQYMDYSSHGMTSQDMMFSGFPGGSVGA